MVTKIGRKRKVERRSRRQPSRTLAELNHEPHKNQLKNKMVKKKQTIETKPMMWMLSIK